MRVADGSSIMGNDIWNLVLSKALSLNFAEFEGGFFGVNSDGLESAFDVVKNTEVLASLGDGDDVHETGGEFMVSSDTVVDLDVLVISVSADLKNFLTVKSVLQSAAEKYGKWEAVSQLVWSSAWAGGVHSTEFGQKPMFGGKHALHMLLRSSSLLKKHPFVKIY